MRESELITLYMPKYIWIQRWTQSWPSSSKSGYVFRFSERARESSPLPFSCATVSVANYALISLSMPNILEYAWINCSISGLWYAQSSDMFGRLFKMPQVLNNPRFWMWHGCVCEGYAEFSMCLIMAPYKAIMPQYALMSLNMPEHGWILLNVLQYTWKCVNKLFWLCQDSRYAAT